MNPSFTLPPPAGLTFLAARIWDTDIVMTRDAVQARVPRDFKPWGDMPFAPGDALWTFTAESLPGLLASMRARGGAGLEEARTIEQVARAWFAWRAPR